MVSGVKDIGGASSVGICREAWNRCSGYPSSYMSWPTLATWLECELCSIAAVATGIAGYSGISLAGGCAC